MVESNIRFCRMRVDHSGTVDRRLQIWLRSVLGLIPPPCLLRRIRNGIRCEATYARTIAFCSTIPTSTMRIPFASEKHANIAKQVIDVDRELQPEVVKRTLTVEGNTLVAYVARYICGRINVQNIQQYIYDTDGSASPPHIKRVPRERRSRRTHDRGVRGGRRARSLIKIGNSPLLLHASYTTRL